MELLDYLNKHGLPEKEEDMSLEQSVIYECTRDIIQHTKYLLEWMEDHLLMYIIYQEELTYDQILEHINYINCYYKEIRSITRCYINDSQYMIDHCNLDEEFLKWINDKDLHNDHEKELLIKYLGCYDSNNEDNIDILLIQDARTEDAKKYFKINT